MNVEALSWKHAFGLILKKRANDNWSDCEFSVLKFAVLGVDEKKSELPYKQLHKDKTFIDDELPVEVYEEAILFETRDDH